ncbi:MAG: ABC transporter permease [Candidatus Phytoplasma sp.]|nr:ABC transporter permease [Phytoplasma sp.]
MKKNKISSNIYLFIIFIFTYLPILSLIVFSFNESKSLTVFTGFSFRWYQELFINREIIDAVVTTITVAIISTVISTVIGTLAAISLSKQKKVFRDITFSINNLPILSPEIITAIAFFILFGTLAITRGMTTMIIAHIAFSTPYVLITVYPKVRSLDSSLIDASHDLGATAKQTLFKVIIPQIKPAIIAGAAIAFTMSFDDFVISYFAASGSTVKNISIYLYTLKRGIEPTVNALSTLIILVIGIKILYDLFKGRKIKEKKIK